MKKLSATIQYILAGGLFAGLLVFIFMNVTDNPRYHLILDSGNLLLQGLWNTLLSSILTLLFSMILGFFLYQMAKSKVPFIKAIAVIFKEIVMGTPLLVMIFLAVYVLGHFAGIGDKFLLGIIAMTLYMAPYLANAYDSAIKIIDEEQYIVMDLYHFTAVQKYRYIIFPQMIRPLMPSLINNLSSIIKGSALLKIVSISEISYVITAISASNWASVEGYLIMWVAYLIITIPLSMLAQYIGRRLAV